MSSREMNPLGDLRREMDRLFESFVGGVNRNLPFRLRTDPPLNLYEDAEKLYAELEVPGVTMNDVEVQVADGGLTVKVSREEPATEGLIFHRQERGVGPLTRIVDLPAAVCPEEVEAVLKNGVLTVTLPKTESAKSRRVAVTGE